MGRVEAEAEVGQTGSWGPEGWRDLTFGETENHTGEQRSSALLGASSNPQNDSRRSKLVSYYKIKVYPHLVGKGER